MTQVFGCAPKRTRRGSRYMRRFPVLSHSHSPGYAQHGAVVHSNSDSTTLAARLPNPRIARAHFLRCWSMRTCTIRTTGKFKVFRQLSSSGDDDDGKRQTEVDRINDERDALADRVARDQALLGHLGVLEDLLRVVEDEAREEGYTCGRIQRISNGPSSTSRVRKKTHLRTRTRSQGRRGCGWPCGA